MDAKTKSEYLKIIKWTIEKLNIQQPYPTITLSTNQMQAQDGHHTGVNYLHENRIWIYIGDRNMIDVARTIMHELCHTRQYQLGMVKPGSSYPGSPVELMADAWAGKYIKIYGKENRQIFESKLAEITHYGDNYHLDRLSDSIPFFEHSPTIGTYKNLSFKIAHNQIFDRTLYALFDGDKLVSLLTLIDSDINLPHGGQQVLQTQTLDNYRNLGCMRFLFNEAIDNYGSILSDDQHSTSAVGMWKALIQNPNGLKIYKYEISTGNSKLLNKKSDLTDVWANNDSIRLVATK